MDTMILSGSDSQSVVDTKQSRDRAAHRTRHDNAPFRRAVVLCCGVGVDEETGATEHLISRIGSQRERHRPQMCMVEWSADDVYALGQRAYVVNLLHGRVIDPFRILPAIPAGVSGSGCRRFTVCFPLKGAGRLGVDVHV